MPEVIVYGASDDLIEVECKELGISEEFSYSSAEDQSILLVSTHGQVVEVRPVLFEYWSAVVTIVSPGRRGEEVIATLIPRPDTEWKGYGDQGVKVSMRGGVNVWKVVPY